MTHNTATKNKKPIDVLEPYKEIILNSVCPCPQGSIALSTAKNAIEAYKKSTDDVDGILELMIYYVECGVEYITEYGGISSNYHMDIETMFEDILTFLKKHKADNIEFYMPRLRSIIKELKETGYGSDEHMQQCLEMAFEDQM